MIDIQIQNPVLWKELPVAWVKTPRSVATQHLMSWVIDENEMKNVFLDVQMAISLEKHQPFFPLNDVHMGKDIFI